MSSLFVVPAAPRTTRDDVVFRINIGIGADGTEPDMFRVKEQFFRALRPLDEPQNKTQRHNRCFYARQKDDKVDGDHYGE